MAELSDSALLLAIGLLNFADDEGYFSANIALIRAAIFPLRKTPAIDALLAELTKVHYIEIATGTDGRRYGRVLKFAEHQRINRPSESLIAAVWKSDGGLTEHSVNDHGGLTDGSLPEGKGSGKEGEGNKERKGTRGSAGEREIAFESFWKAYPRKDDKAEARKAFEKVDVDVSILLKALEWQRRQESWVSDGGKFIPYGAKWLNKRRWEDEPRRAGISAARQAANDGRLYPGPLKGNIVRIPDPDPSLFPPTIDKNGAA